jgi:hypothetical protein
MRDCVSGEGLSNDEETTNFATLLTDDPFYYEDAVKYEMWRKAMDSEIEAIEKNNTWQLMELPTGGKVIGGGCIKLSSTRMEKSINTGHD